MKRYSLVLAVLFFLYATTALASGMGVLSGNATSVAPGLIVNADVNPSAGIDAAKLGAGNIDNTELGHLNGVTSAIQTQLDEKLSTTGNAATATRLTSTPMQNLLTNSGFGVWSNATLENVGSNLITAWTNADYDTFTTSGADISSAIYTTAGTQDASSNAATTTSGKLYKIVATLTLTSGQAPTLTLTNASVASKTLSAGANTIIFESTGASCTITYSNTAASNSACTFTLYEVTPGCVAADALGPDGWEKNRDGGSYPLVYREHKGTNTKPGAFYAVKIETDAAGKHLRWPNSTVMSLAEHRWRFAGKVTTFGAWIKTSTASSARLTLADDSGSTSSSYHTGGGSYEWITVTKTWDTDPAYVRVMIRVEQIDNVYVTKPQMIFGSAIGSDDYILPPGEIIHIEAAIALTDYTATTAAADGTINLEAQSSGKIPKGAKAVLVKAYGKDSAAGDGVGFDVQSTSGVENGIAVDTQANNIRVQGQGWVATDTSGDIYFDHRGSGASALTVDIKVVGIQIN